MRHAWTLTATAALLLTFGCEDDPRSGILDAEAPEPGDPAVYAPDGWPLQIGDKITLARWEELRDQYRWCYQSFIHATGGELHQGRFRSGPGTLADETDRDALWWAEQSGQGAHKVYEGHFPRGPMPAKCRETEPANFAGNVKYYTPGPKPNGGHSPPRLIDENGREVRNGGEIYG